MGALCAARHTDPVPSLSTWPLPTSFWLCLYHQLLLSLSPLPGLPLFPPPRKETARETVARRDAGTLERWNAPQTPNKPFKNWNWNWNHTCHIKRRLPFSSTCLEPTRSKAPHHRISVRSFRHISYHVMLLFRYCLIAPLGASQIHPAQHLLIILQRTKAHGGCSEEPASCARCNPD